MAPTTYPPYLREKARQLRRERQLTIDQLAECLALPRTTIYYWVRDLPIPRYTIADWPKSAQQRGNRAMQKKYRLLRETAYEEGLAMFATLSNAPTFQHFVVLYMVEGYKRCRNHVSIANSDHVVIQLATWWIRRLTRNKVVYSLQYHADQNVDALREFWAGQLDISPAAIRLQRKSNSNQLARRRWRSVHGVLSVGVGDTYLHARLRAWMDCQRKEWLDSVSAGV